MKESRTWQHCAAKQSALVQTKIAKPKGFTRQAMAMLVLAKKLGLGPGLGELSTAADILSSTFVISFIHKLKQLRSLLL